MCFVDGLKLDAVLGVVGLLVSRYYFSIIHFRWKQDLPDLPVRLVLVL